jgi:hypothetical protein
MEISVSTSGAGVLFSKMLGGFLHSISIPINTLQILLEVLRPAMKMDQLGLLICKNIGGGGNLWYGIDDSTNGGTKNILRWKLQKLTGTCITSFFNYCFQF